jgi:hypothetical protein
MMNIAEQYTYDMLLTGRNPSGRKLSTFKAKIDRTVVYNKLHGISTPNCTICSKPLTDIKSFKEGYLKYCGQACYNKQLSAQNTIRNSAKNKKRGEEITAAVLPSVIAAANYYNENSLSTIRQVAALYNIPHERLRQYLELHKMSTPERKRDLRADILDKKFSDKKKQLLDEDWVKARIAEGWTSHHFAAHLECSRDYISTFIRNNTSVSLPKSSSSHEYDVKEFAEHHGFDVLSNSRKIIKPKELDVFIPAANVAVEVNGIYWHCNTRVNNKYYHYDKTKECEAKNIRLLHFYDYEFKLKRDIVFSILGAALGLNKKVYARQCSIRELSNIEYFDFCNTNHIQGKVNAKIKYGLVSNNEIIACISFGKSRFNKKYQFELLRYCNKLGHTVVGGASKLFKHFLKQHNPNTVISYAQRRLFNGNMYSSLGFNLIDTSAPNYFWVNVKGNILTRYQTQKHKISNEDNKLMTEVQIMKSKNYYQIFDSGQNVFVYNKVA